MAINNITSNSASSASTASASSSTNNTTVDDAQSRFMTLLVAQMQHQDPLNPMDNQDLTAQIAQLNTVSGINKLNTSVESLLSSFQTSQTMQSANLIGRDVLVDSPNVRLQNGQLSSPLMVELPKSVDSMDVEIVNTFGQTVQTLSVRDLAAGKQVLAWDGKGSNGATLPDGSYTLKVTASAAGAEVTATPLSVGKVDGLSVSGGVVSLTSPALGTVALSKVREVR